MTGPARPPLWILKEDEARAASDEPGMYSVVRFLWDDGCGEEVAFYEGRELYRFSGGIRSLVVG